MPLPSLSDNGTRAAMATACFRTRGRNQPASGYARLVGRYQCNRGKQVLIKLAEESQNQNSTAINIFLKKKVRILLKSTYYKDPKVFYF